MSTERHSSTAFGSGGWRTTHAPPRLALEPFTIGELQALLRGGELGADVCERLLASFARARAAIDVAIGEGLDALRHGDRLAQLGCHLDDYGREVLDLGKRATQNLARLGRELRTGAVRRCARGGSGSARRRPSCRSRSATPRRNG